VVLGVDLALSLPAKVHYLHFLFVYPDLFPLRLESSSSGLCSSPAGCTLRMSLQ
jgi:hypothetical protein